MKQISNLFVASLALFLFIAEPALAQSIDLSPIQSLFAGHCRCADWPTWRCHRDACRSRGSFSAGSSTSSICARRFGSSWASPVFRPPPPSLPRSLPVAERSPLFSRARAPAEAFGPAHHVRDGLALRIGALVRLGPAHRGAGCRGPALPVALEGRRLGPAFHRRDGDGAAGDTAHAQQVHSWRGQLCPVMTPVMLRSMPAQ